MFKILIARDNNKICAVLFAVLSFLPRIKAPLAFDLDEIVFDSDPIETGPPFRLKCKSVQMNVGEGFNRFFPRKRSNTYYDLDQSLQSGQQSCNL